jgi:hypothetical protein
VRESVRRETTHYASTLLKTGYNLTSSNPTSAKHQHAVPDDKLDGLLAAQEWAVLMDDRILKYLVEAALLHIAESYLQTEKLDS